MNLVHHVADAAAERGDAPALVYDGQETSYETFWTRAGQFAAGLAEHGIGVSARIVDDEFVE